MTVKVFSLLALCLVIAVAPVYAQNRSGENDGKLDGIAHDGIARDDIAPSFPQNQREDFWLAPGGEITRYSITNFSYGGGLSLGYGDGLSLGFKAAWFIDGKGEVSTLELGILLRWYMLDSSSGPFLQFTGGPAFFSKDKKLNAPSELGFVSAGLSLGWRFLAGKFWFIEGALRSGFPYIAGIGLSAGMHFSGTHY